VDRLHQISSLEAVVHAHILTGRRGCRLPDPVVGAIIERGLFRIWIPRRYGGAELSLPEALQIYEAAARLDGSLGWSVMIGSGGGLFAAYLEPQVAAALFEPHASVVAGSGAPSGTAERVAGGYRVSGRWRYASGADYATVFTANCHVTERDSPVMSAGQPLIRAMALDPKDVIIHRTWDTSGLRATGSHDIEVIQAFVPTNATFSVFADLPLETGPLYRVPFGTLTELPVSAVALGIAEHALEEFVSLAHAKRPAGSAVPLDRLEAVQASVRTVRRRIGAAQRALYEQAHRVWHATVTSGRPDENTLRACTEGSVRLVRKLVSAIADLVPLSGMNALQAEDPFAVTWRDLEAVAAHHSVSPVNLLS
jgi:alkylation response protein AidB-like acyl-CoA dehydrogenase